MEIKELVIKAKNNDSKAWDALFRQTKDMVYFTALKLCSDKQTAEDIVQETYIKAIENISSLSAPEAFVTWLRTIAVNTARNYLVKKSPTVFGSDESDELLINAPETEEDFLPAEYASKRETARIIMRIVDSLPEKQRVTVILYYYNEMTVADIAAMMNVSENTVKSRLNYARTEIKCQVEELEKKGTKLHGAAVPFLALALREAAKDYVLAEEAVAATMATIATTTAATAYATATATATTATSGGIMAKIAALPLATKIIAGVVAAGVALSGVGLGASIVIGGATVAKQILSDSSGKDTSISVSGQKDYEKFDLSKLIYIDASEIESMFGKNFEVLSSEGKLQIIQYEVKHQNGIDNLVFEVDNETNRILEVSFYGSLFNYDGICTVSDASKVKKTITELGYELEYSQNFSNEEGNYTQENYLTNDENVDLRLIYSGEEIWGLAIYPSQHYYNTISEDYHAVTTEEIATEEIATAEEIVTEEVTTTAPVAAPKTELIYTFTQNDSYVNGVSRDYIPTIKMYSDGSFDGLANINRATLKLKGTWEEIGGGAFSFRLTMPSRFDEFQAENFTIIYKAAEGVGVINFPSGDNMVVTVDGSTFSVSTNTATPNPNTNEGAHEILENFRKNNHTNSNGSKSYAYVDLTHDGIEELVVMTNTYDFSGEAYYEVFVLKDGKPTRIYKDGTGFTTNSLYEHHVYFENGKAYLMSAAFFERQGSPWYFYKIFSLDANGNEVYYKGRDVSLDYGYTDYSPLDLVKSEYKECLKSAKLLVTPGDDLMTDMRATLGWWYK